MNLDRHDHLHKSYAPPLSVLSSGPTFADGMDAMASGSGSRFTLRAAEWGVSEVNTRPGYPPIS